VSGMYEAMFLLDPSQAPTWEAAEAECKRLLDRAGAKVIGLKRWDERKLAYEIKRRKRGVYALAFFEASSEKIADMERDARISDVILRLLVLNRDDLKSEVIQNMLTAAPPSSRGSDRPMEMDMDRGPRPMVRAGAMDDGPGDDMGEA